MHCPYPQLVVSIHGCVLAVQYFMLFLKTTDAHDSTAAPQVTPAEDDKATTRSEDTITSAAPEELPPAITLSHGTTLWFDEVQTTRPVEALHSTQGGELIHLND